MHLKGGAYVVIQSDFKVNVCVGVCVCMAGGGVETYDLVLVIYH